MIRLDKKHYCFDGTLHEDICSCSCQSCSACMADIKRRLFNKRLSEKIKESYRTLFCDREFVDAFIKELRK